MNHSIEQVLSAQMLITDARSAVEDRNAGKFLSVYSDRNKLYLLGFVRSLYRTDKEAFEWVMYILSINKGYEEFVCKFWIANWQINEQNQAR